MDILYFFAAGALGVMFPKYLGYVAYEIFKGKFKAEQDCYPLMEVKGPLKTDPIHQDEEEHGEQGQA